MREGTDIVVTFRVQSSNTQYRFNSMLAREIGQTVDDVDGLDPVGMKYLAARIVVHLHGGRLQVDDTGSMSALRMFFPVPAAVQSSNPQLVAYAAPAE